MALPTPNTDPRKGRVTTTTSGAGAAVSNETTEMAKGITDIEDVISKRLEDMSGFLEIMKNYIPKLGFIDAHTKAIKLSTDQMKKDLKEVAKQLTETPGEESDAQEVNEEGNEAEQTIADRIRNIDENVQKMADKIDEPSEAQEDARDLGGADAGTDAPEVMDDGDGGDDGGAEKKQSVIGKALGGFMKVFKMIGKFAAVALLVILPLLSGNQKLFEAIKETVMNVFELFKSLFDVVMQAIVPLATTILTIILNIGNTIFSALMPILDSLIPVIISVVSVVTDVIMGIFDAIMPIIQVMLDILVPIIQMVLNVFLFLFENILGPIFSVLTPIVTFVGNMIMGFFNMLISVWNGIIEAVAFIAGIFGKGDEVRSLKIDKLGEDTSEEEAKKLIDFSQEDEAIEAQIQAKVDSGEINEETAEKLRKNKQQHKADQEQRRQEMVAKYDVKEIDMDVEGDDDGEKIKLISFNMDEATNGYIKEVLFDPESQDEDGNYQFYKPDGTPMKFRGHLRKPANMMAHAARKNLEPIEVDGEDGGDALPGNIAAAFGMTGDELSDESLDTQDAIGAAAVGAGAGGGSSSVNVVGGSSSTTNVKNEQSVTSTSSSPTSGRGRRFRR